MRRSEKYVDDKMNHNESKNNILYHSLKSKKGPRKLKITLFHGMYMPIIPIQKFYTLIVGSLYPDITIDPK